MHPNHQKLFKIVVADPLHKSGLEILQKASDVIFQGPFDCDFDLLDLHAADALLICSDTSVDADLISGAPNLKIVARAGARLDNVDIDAATRRGILVTHVPDANVLAVVEYTFLLILAMARNFPQNESSEQRLGENLGFQLSGKTLGIIGFGRHGREVAIRAQAFGMHVLAYDPYVDLSFARERAVEMVDYPELLGRADLISLHTAYTPQTHHIISAQAFAQMKPGAFLINSVHSELVDETALKAALQDGVLGGVACDTWDQSPHQRPDWQRNHPKVLVSSNWNQATYEAYSNTAVQVVTDMLAALRGEDYRNVVNLPFNNDSPYQVVKPYIDLAVKLGKLLGQLAEGWIKRVEIELQGESLQNLVRPVAAVLLSGMVRSVGQQRVNWVSAPALAFEQGILTFQTKNLIQTSEYSALIACRIYWDTGQRTVAGALFGNGEARLVHYDGFEVDAYPDGYVLILENEDVPGVIGKVGTRLGQEKINIAQWRYGREGPGGRAVSFINLDQRVPQAILTELEQVPQIHHARLVRL